MATRTPALSTPASSAAPVAAPTQVAMAASQLATEASSRTAALASRAALATQAAKTAALTSAASSSSSLVGKVTGVSGKMVVGGSQALARRAPPSSLMSALTISLITFASKAFLKATTTVNLSGEDTLFKALGIGKFKGQAGDVAQGRRRGILTIANHNSVVDDPMMWSILPTSTYFPLAKPSHTCHNNRWTLGASDIMFTSALTSKFFAAGQVISTVRGGGIYQEAVDTAIQRIQEGGWVHIFPEGRVNQEHLNNPDGGLHRFKWGVGRILMDSEELPEIIPIWISGFDQIMNEKRGFPRFIPRGGSTVSITIGESLTPLIQPVVDKWRASLPRTQDPPTIETVQAGDQAEAEESDTAALRAHQSEHADYLHGAFDPDEQVRREITAMLQDGLRALGERVEAAEGRFERGEWSQSRKRVSA